MEQYRYETIGRGGLTQVPIYELANLPREISQARRPALLEPDPVRPQMIVFAAGNLIGQSTSLPAARVPTVDETHQEPTLGHLTQLLQISRGRVTQFSKLAGRNRMAFYKLLGAHEIPPDGCKRR